jgi:hypothetical protein
MVAAILVLLWTFKGFRVRCREKRLELMRYVDDIQEESGCGNADDLFLQCVHISKHYEIPFVSVDFYGGFEGLRALAIESLERYKKRMEEQAKGCPHGISRDEVPGPLWLDLGRRLRELRAFKIV